MKDDLAFGSEDIIIPPLGEGESLLLVFGASQTSLHSVSIGSTSVPPVEGRRLAIFPPGDLPPGGLVAKAGYWYWGAPPFIERVVSLPGPYTAELDGRKALEHLAKGEEAKSLRDAIDARLQQLPPGSQKTGPLDGYRRFFLRYDALTDVDVLECLWGEKSLSPVDILRDPPRPEFPFFTINALRYKIHLNLIHRAGQHGSSTAVEPNDCWNLISSELTAAGPPSTIVKQLATYQRSIFTQEFGDSAKALWPAFMAFANGKLCYRKRSGSYNAEPDSAYFFGFAEFAVLASKPAQPHAAYWCELLLLFTALEEVYTHAYPPRGTSTFEAYKPQVHRRPRSKTDQEVSDLLALYQRRYATRDALVRRHAENAFRAFRDDPMVCPPAEQPGQGPIPAM